MTKQIFNKEEYGYAIGELIETTTKMEIQKKLLHLAILDNPQWALGEGYLKIDFQLPPIQRIANQQATEEIGK